MSLPLPPSRCRRFAALGGLAAMLLFAGCANPGPLEPPSAHLPELARALTAERTGDVVTVRWMPPRRSSDGAPLRGATEAVLCRQVSSTGTCTPVAHRTEASPADGKPPADSVSERLPAALLAGPPRILYYRVEERNRSGRSAGVSEPVAVLAGEAPPAVEGFSVTGSREGAVLRWRVDPIPDQTVMVERQTPGTARAKGEDVILQPEAGAHADAGGMVDTTAKPGWTYTYTARRVLHRQAAAEVLTLSGAASATQTLTLAADYPPPAPTSLLAVAELSPASGDATAVNLSWVPPLAAGLRYNVYRLAGTTTAKLNGTPLTAAAFHDGSLPSGVTIWSYTVRAVDAAGLQSAPTSSVSIQR